jgi:hypothetical protein
MPAYRHSLRVASRLTPPSDEDIDTLAEEHAKAASDVADAVCAQARGQVAPHVTTLCRQVRDELAQQHAHAVEYRRATGNEYLPPVERMKAKGEAEAKNMKLHKLTGKMTELANK